MPYDNLCSIYPLLRHEQDKQHLRAQHKLSSIHSTREGRVRTRIHAKGSSSSKKGPWTAEEDAALLAHVSVYGDGNWNSVRQCTGISRCGKSCRLRWTNHLRPNLQKGPLQPYEELLIIQQHALLGNRWSRIAAMLPGRTDNEVKNFWNTRKKRFERAGLPLYPEDDAISSVEDLKGDICATSSTYNTVTSASTKEMTHSGNFSPRAYCGAMVSNYWSCSAVSITEHKVGKASMMPSFSVLDSGIQGLEQAGDAQIVGEIRKAATVMTLKAPFPEGELSFDNLSNGVMTQPMSKPRCLYGNNMTSADGAIFPCIAEPLGDSANRSGSPRANLSFSCGTAGSGGSVNNTSCRASSFSTGSSSIFRQGNYLSCLKEELPSVQLAESADSSSALVTPYAMSHTLPFLEIDSLSFAGNNSVNGKNGSLLDAVSQQKALGHGNMQADLAERICLVSPIDASSAASSAESNTPTSVSSTTSGLFSSFRQGDFLSYLKVELPSVQMAESADSSAALLSPYALSQMLPVSEADGLSFTSDSSVNKKTGSLMDVLSHQKVLGHGHIQAAVAEKTSCASLINASATTPNTENLFRMVNYDPPPFLGGFPSTVFSPSVNTAVQPTGLSSLGLCAGPPLLIELPTGGDVFQSNSRRQGGVPIGLEMKDHAFAQNIDEKMVTAVGFERLTGFCGPESYVKNLYTVALPYQAEEIVKDADGGMILRGEHSDAMAEVGHSEVTSEVGDDGMVCSSVDSWDSRSWVWSYMPRLI